MRRLSHLGQVDIFADCRANLEDLENILKMFMTD
jgi:hypothetical protein